MKLIYNINFFELFKQLLYWLNYLFYRARIVDFHKGDKDNTHPLLFKWVENYFTTNSGKETCPLYIQHQGEIVMSSCY